MTRLLLAPKALAAIGSSPVFLKEADRCVSGQWQHVEYTEVCRLGWAGAGQAEAGHPGGLLVVTCPGGGMRTWGQGPALGGRGKGQLRGVGPLEVGQKAP